MHYDAVVFDNDGVLVGRTSYDVLQAAARDTFEQFDVDPTDDHIHDVTVGATPNKVQQICDTYGLRRVLARTRPHERPLPETRGP